MDKNKYKQIGPKVSTRPTSKDKPRTQQKEEVQFLSFEKQNNLPPKINGGQKVSSQNSGDHGDHNSGENSVKGGNSMNGANSVHNDSSNLKESMKESMK